MAVGPNLTKLLHDTLGYMFAFGLSKALVESLTRIVEHIPPLLRTIQGMHFNSVHTMSSFMLLL